MIDPMKMNQMITSVRVDIDIEYINIGMDLSYPAIRVDIGMEEIRFEPWKKFKILRNVQDSTRNENLTSMDLTSFLEG